MSADAEKPLPPAPEPARQVKPVAVIDVGATSIRMAIAEIDDVGNSRILETLSQAVNLGRDTFTKSAIDRATIEECVRVLRSYARALKEYGITRPDQIRIVATSAVREANNRLAFVDRVYIATDMQIEPLDEAEVNRITYLGMQKYLRGEPTLANATTIIVEVGGGSTELLMVKNNDVVYSHTYRLGSLRLRKQLESYRTPALKVRNIMESQIARTVEQIVDALPPDTQAIEMVAIGGDVRFAASELLPDWSPQSLARLSVAGLERFTDGILQLSDDDIVQQYHLSFPAAETVGAALLSYVKIARALKLKNILVTNVTLRDGLLREMAGQAALSDEFSAQIERSAIDLGNKFGFDEAHARHVAHLCRLLFRLLKDEHELDPRYETVLAIAALLHEIGTFISIRSYHKHSMYLIKNSELFGLSKQDVLLVSLVARYQRRASPQPEHEGYNTLNREHRIAVAKMAALLRLAIALDDARSQRIHEMVCEVEEGRLVISIPHVDDLSLEQLSMRQNSSLFEEVFGLKVLLRKVKA
jgi:exopolyphosphatase/guanosine-5'-triphosphate,3'-diphosphate pyrophosphatase